MFVDAFVKGLRTNPFSESLLRDKVETMAMVYRRATTHIEAEEVLKKIWVGKRHYLIKHHHHSEKRKHGG